MVNEILFTSLFGHMPREGEGMCTEEHKKVCFQVLTLLFFMLILALEFPQHFSVTSTIVSKYSMPNLQCL